MNNIQNQFVSYEIALKLKELGFNEECLFTYFTGDLYNRYEFESLHGYSVESDGIKNEDLYSGEILAPTYYQVVDWLYENHKLYLFVKLEDHIKKFGFYATIADSGNREYNDMDLVDQASTHMYWKDLYKTKNEAYIFGINKAFEIIEKNKDK